MTAKRKTQNKEVAALKAKRKQLQAQLSALEAKLARLEKPATKATAKGRAKAPAKAPKAAAKAEKPAVKSQKVLREEITAALAKAGAKGISLPQIAKNLGVKPEVVKAWFSAHSKSIKGLKQIANGRYGIIAVASKGAAKPVKKAAIKAPAKKAARGKAPKVKRAKVVSKASENPSKRGELKSDILSILKAAGSEGATISDLSVKLNKPYKNLYIWFVTTGKRIAGIKKVAPARYALLG